MSAAITQGAIHMTSMNTAAQFFFSYYYFFTVKK